MKKIHVTGTYEVRQEVTIDAYEALIAIKQSLGFDDDVTKINNKLIRREDISHHGSACFKDTPFPDDPELIKVYDAIETIRKHFIKLSQKPTPKPINPIKFE